LTVTPAVLDEIISSGLVKSVSENGWLKTTLLNTVPLVGADTLHTASTTGAGTVIAILDTGIQKEHDYFKNGVNTRVIAEACFTGNNGIDPGTCPNAGLTQTGAGSARPCGPTSPLDNACFHGTHVAGIAAGNDMFDFTAGSVGVAPAADIVSIQIFTFLEPGKIRASFFDIAAGLEYVLNLQDGTLDDTVGTFNIVSANLSLGTDDTFTTTCDNAAGGAVTSAINDLDAAGVAVIVSSGNAGIVNGIAFPACITKAISVGSVDRFDYAPKYSNIADFLDLLAPGGNRDCDIEKPSCFFDKGTDDGVLSAFFHETLTNQLAFATGTSMAAPHVAGANKSRILDILEYFGA